MQLIDALEIHVVHSCNLTCESCSHYSNQGHDGIVSLAEAEEWMRAWHHRVRPRTFSLLGGEPTIHPQLTDFVSLARSHWPEAKLQLVTNGFLLHRHPDLPRVLANDANACIALSIHHTAPEYRARLMPVMALLVDWTRQGVRVECRPSHTSWTRRYKSFGATMQPFTDERPRQSWENCAAKFCMQLFQGKLWKCPPIAYLRLQDAKYGLNTAWQPYLQYEPLSANCSDFELTEFLAREDESVCRMCPAQPEHFAMPSPLGRTISP
jgi:hypothetical protein